MFFGNSSTKKLVPRPLLTQATWYSSKNNTGKRNFRSRLTVSVFVLLFLAIFLFFSSLGDICNHWSLVSNHAWKFVFTLIDVVAISSLIVFVNLELRKIFYANSPKVFAYFLTINLVFFYGISLVYLLPLYQFFPKLIKIENAHWCSDFALKPIRWLVVAYLGLIFISVFLFVKLFHSHWQNCWFFSLLYIHIVVMMGIFSMVYLLVVSGWTTFLFLALISMSSDTMSFLFGSKFGKNKIARKISPNKTWEGLIYGLLSTLILMLLLVWAYSLSTGSVKNDHHTLINIFLNRPNIGRHQPRGYFYYWVITAGAIIILLIISNDVGDLIMSYVKRIFQIKDFSNLLRAHGGILDRIDGLTCVFFVFMCVWSIFCLCSGDSVDMLNPDCNAQALADAASNFA